VLSTTPTHLAIHHGNLLRFPRPLPTEIPYLHSRILYRFKAPVSQGDVSGICPFEKCNRERAVDVCITILASFDPQSSYSDEHAGSTPHRHGINQALCILPCCTARVRGSRFLPLLRRGCFITVWHSEKLNVTDWNNTA
jgi:hypothetical protein